MIRRALRFALPLALFAALSSGCCYDPYYDCAPVYYAPACPPPVYYSPTPVYFHPSYHRTTWCR